MKHFFTYCTKPKETFLPVPGPQGVDCLDDHDISVVLQSILSRKDAVEFYEVVATDESGKVVMVLRSAERHRKLVPWILNENEVLNILNTITGASYTERGPASIFLARDETVLERTLPTWPVTSADPSGAINYNTGDIKFNFNANMGAFNQSMKKAEESLKKFGDAAIKAMSEKIRKDMVNMFAIPPHLLPKNGPNKSFRGFGA